MRRGEKIKVGIVSLGCPKALVDSEVILGKVQSAGYKIVRDLAESDVVVLNTCGFIGDAKEESIDALLQLLEMKKARKIRGLIVLGCLVQRYAAELRKEFPEVDAFMGSGDYTRVAAMLKKVAAGKKFISAQRAGYLAKSRENRVALTPFYFRYLKISEGCDHTCSFCVIPSMRGRYRSRSIPDLVTEARRLAGEGARELVLIGQDVTQYGKDRAGRSLLPELLRAFEPLKRIRWIRLLYAYPGTLTEEILRAVDRSPQVCRYIDLPLQHINDKILRAMSRGGTRAQIVSWIHKIRTLIPGVVIRTSFIVGFPGETEKDFQELLAFMRETRFDRLGIFRYSREEGTPAASFPGQVPEKVKEERFHRAMQLQRKIVRAANRRFLRCELQVLVEARDERGPGRWIGRSYMDAPEIDGNVLVASSKKLTVGKFYTVKITDTKDYDLIGKI